MNGVLLVTGFPALRARHIVRALLTRDAAVRVVVLVARERADEARAVLSREALAERVSLVEGDPTAIDFGLGGARYLELARQVRIVHAAYSITDAAPERIAEAVNVGQARELVELVRVAPELRAIVLYSSVFVSGQRSGIVKEAELEAGQGVRGPVERTLATAEKMLRDSHVPRIVLRAGHLLGDTAEGEVEHLTGPYWLLAFIASASKDAPLPVLPGADAPLCITPVDYLARFGAFAGERAAPGSTFHVIDPARLTLRQFLAEVAERSGRRLEPGFHPSSLTRLLAGNPALKGLPQQVRSLLEVLTGSAEYASDGALDLVNHGAPECPPFASYLDRLFDHVRARLERGDLFSSRRQSPAFLVA
ncbi:MAG TPA: SDR family oxidoreductase [Polyangiaceae bacterium]|nr:SDR family oxidoreductase [Polyangiaceae bacterium]